MPRLSENPNPPPAPISAPHDTVSPSYPTGVRNFLQYATDPYAIRTHPDRAYEVGTTLVQADLVHLVPDEHLLKFSQRLLKFVAIDLARDRSSPARTWIELVQNFLSRVTTKEKLRDFLQAHCSALSGNTKPAEAILRSEDERAVVGRYKTDLYNVLLVSLAMNFGHAALFEYFLRGIPYLPAFNFTSSPALRVLSEAMEDRFGSTSELPAVHPAVTFFSDILLRLRRTKGEVPSDWWRETLSAAMLNQSDLLEREFRLLQRTGTSEQELKSKAPTTANRAKQLQLVRDLLALGSQDDPHWHNGMLYLASRSGDTTAAEQHFSRLSAMDQVESMAIDSLLVAYAEAGDIHGLTIAFDRLFPDPSSWSRTLKASRFSPAFLAILRAPGPDHEALQHWKDRLAFAGLQPNAMIYSHLVQYYAKHNMDQDIISTFEEIQAGGVPVNKFVYQNGMTFFARRRDPLTVEALFKRAVDSGIKPDMHILTTLMNAHVEAGSWKGLMNAYKYYQSNNVPGSSPVKIFNIFAKAAHLLGHPFSTIYDNFQTLKEQGHTPDAQTYVTLLHAAVDAGDLASAGRLYEEMVSQRGRIPKIIGPQVYTLLFEGAFRQGEIQTILYYYNQMKRYKVKPNSMIFNKFLWNVSRLEDRELARVAPILDEMKAGMGESDEWKVPAFGGLDWLDQIYLPTMSVALRSDTPWKVQEIFDEVKALGYQPTLDMKILLLRSYGLRNDYDAVLELWADIFREATNIRAQGARLQTPKMQSLNRAVPSEKLAAAFSVYIDALSLSAHHKEITPAIDGYRAEGFKLTEGNWNHIILAYLRAGFPAIAFRAVAEIFQPLITLPILKKEESLGPKSQGWTPLLSEVASPHLASRYSPSPLRSPAQRASKQRELQSGEELVQRETWELTHKTKRALLATRIALYSGFLFRRTEPGEMEVPAISRYYPRRARRRISEIKRKSRRAWELLSEFQVEEQERLGDKRLMDYRPFEPWLQERRQKKAMAALRRRQIANRRKRAEYRERWYLERERKAALLQAK